MNRLLMKLKQMKMITNKVDSKFFYRVITAIPLSSGSSNQSLIGTLLVMMSLLISMPNYAQMADFDYQKELKEQREQWHKIELPNDIFSKINPNFTDLRIYGVTPNKDTIEAPYILKSQKEMSIIKEADFTIINQSKTAEGYYFTFELTTEKNINQIKLAFAEDNFDWNLQLDGSQNQQKWFTVLDDYRILSIKNNSTNYQFTTLHFPDAKYRFFRILIKQTAQPNLKTATIASQNWTDGNYRNHPIKQTQIAEDKAKKQTVIDLDLGSSIPISYLQLQINETVDFYRPITVQYLVDSVKTEKGWKYNYRNLMKGTLTSFEKNELKFNSVTTPKLRLLIYNQDNQPLKITSFEAKGYIYELVVRFTTPAQYYLVYGKERARKPNYDIARFQENIPTELTTLILGKEARIAKKDTITSSPLFESKWWLWGVMLLIIFLLGGASLQMMKKKVD